MGAVDRSAMIGAYLDAGLALVPFPRGRKGPNQEGWNLRENCILSREDAAVKLNGDCSFGIAHVYCEPSPTCAIDVDDIEKARPWLKERGVDIDALLAAPDAVRIHSGREGRAKLLYRLPCSMRTYKVAGGGLELRCASKEGKTLQDVLPPSIHPDTGKPYNLTGDIKKIPPIPQALHSAWRTHDRRRSGGKKEAGSGAPTTDVDGGKLPQRFHELLDSDGKLRKRWDGNTEGLEEDDRSTLDMSLTALTVIRGFNDAEISAIHHAFPHGKVVQDGRDGDYIEDMIAKARRNRTLSPAEPLLSARRFIAERFTTPDGTVLLRHWRGDLYLWCGGAYQMVEPRDIEAQVYAYLEGAQCMTKKGLKPFGPNRTKVGEVLGALRAVVHLDSRLAPPCWIDGADGDDPHDLLVAANGILHIPSRELRPHDPRLFTTTALPFAYDAKASAPHWLQFLRDLWGNDDESIETLQEHFGYVLVYDTSRQKILLVVGPRRGGKGTVARMQRALIGDDNYVGPTLSSLGTNFGLQPLIGKRVAVISDARLGGRADQQTLAERLLSISGEDALTIDRKYGEPWTGALGVRFMILTNELPRIADASGALASRFVVLRLTNSWLGREDLGLTDRLMTELPGILNWALDGLARLRERGQFRQPASALELTQELADLSSPISAFLRDCCTIDPQAQVQCSALFAAWRLWCGAHGRDHPGTEATFGRDLRGALPELHTANLRTPDGRQRFFTGLRLGARRPDDLL